MVGIRFIEHDGTVHDVDGDAGWSLMQAALANVVPGIDADCGGQCACGTCHVYIDPAWRDRLDAATPEELEMVAFADEATEDSRLSCQIALTDAMDGLIVRPPQFQH